MLDDILFLCGQNHPAIGDEIFHYYCGWLLYQTQKACPYTGVETGFVINKTY